MSLTLIGRDTLPVSTRGAVGKLSIRVANNGQIGFSTSAGKLFENATACTVGWDAESRKMVFTPMDLNKLPKGVKKEATFTVGQSKDGANRYISAAGLFKLPSVAYDYSVGSYSFDANIEGDKIVFVLPASMAVKEVKKRTPKAKTAATGAATTASDAGSGEPELVE